MTLLILSATATSNHTIALSPNELELASPFLLTTLIIVISAWLVPDIIDRLEKDFLHTEAEAKKAAEAKDVVPDGRRQKPPKEPPADQAPETRAKASVWAIDTAQIPMMIGGPAAGVFLLHHALPEVFVFGYAGLLTVGIIFFVTFRRLVPISGYIHRGPTILRVRLSPLVLFGITLNLAGAAIAAFVVG